MENQGYNKRKILNDPIYGFVTIPYDIVLDVIDHPYFQRLRRIKQLGLTSQVYPGALHTRFHHAVGAMWLMQQAIDSIRLKGHEITEEEALGATLAILLHDIGHGPFSHALEYSIVHEVTHEDVSRLIMERLNAHFDGQLSTGIAIFTNQYPKKFLHQLVSSQLDMDRLDYLKRDSFYTGVSEGVISNDRIIKMLNVRNDQLVVEEKGIYSIEKFIIARRLMYWQVYLHKAVVSAEFLLVNILQRAKKLASTGEKLWASPSLALFLENRFNKHDFEENPDVLEAFVNLDDYDIMGAIKVWQAHPDKVLSALCQWLVNRNLFRIEISKAPFSESYIQELQERIAAKFDLGLEDAAHFMVCDQLKNNAYDPYDDSIDILLKNGQLKDIAQASDNLNITALSAPVTKYFICYPKSLN